MAHYDSLGAGGMTPHQMVFGRDRNLPGIPYSTLKEAEDARGFLDRMRNIDTLVGDRLNQLHVDQAERFNAHKRDRRTFNVGDSVWLIKPKQVGGNKISSWWTGPYTIVQRLGRDVFNLKISLTENLEVHTDQLKIFHPDTILEGGIPLFYDSTDRREKSPLEVERVRAHRAAHGGLEFLVHWKGAPNAEDSWEKPERFLIIFSQAWVDYCKDHNLYADIQEFPVQPSLIPRDTPTDQIGDH